MASLKYGVSSVEVKRLQENLNAVFKQSVVPVSGSYDEETAAAVDQFQAEAGLPQTGQFDAKTAEALREALIPRTAIKLQGQNVLPHQGGVQRSQKPTSNGCEESRESPSRLHQHGQGGTDVVERAPRSANSSAT
jgi:peptidoglycan hydrolase-like protein with peptidoglycan-binding domain